MPNYYVYSYLDLAFLMVSSPPQRKPDSLAALFVFAFCLVMIASSRGMGETYAIFLLPLSETFSWTRANVTSIYAIYMVAFGFARYCPVWCLTDLGHVSTI